MKNPGKLLTASFLLFLSVSICLADGFNSIVSVNGSVIWIVGPNGGVYRSYDGGQSLVNHSIGTVNYNDVFSRLLYLWIVGDNGTLLLSTNAGGSFSEFNIGGGVNLKSIFFIDDNTGWIACDSGKILKSTDGGNNWNEQNSSENTNLNRIKFIDVSTGIACGNSGTLLVTTDGGTTWNHSSVPVSKDILSADISVNTIFASCTDGIVLKSTNLGSSWSIIDYKISTKSDITSVWMINPDKYFSCGTGGFIRLSRDGGNTFEFQNNPAWTDLNRLYFFDSSRGWAISKDIKIVLRTTDGGRTWLMPNGTVQSLSWVLKVPLTYYTSSGNDFYQSSWNKKEIFITKSNTVLRSLDVGETWSQVGTPMPYGSVSNSFFVSPIDTNIFLVAIDSNDQVTGKVLRSADYGQTWTATFAGNRSSDGTPMAMDPNHPDTVYYGPTDSSLFRSTDFGLTWTAVSQRHFDNVCIIKVLESNSNTILVGGAGTLTSHTSHLVRSTDFGLTWTMVDSNTGYYPEVPVVISSMLSPILYCAQYEGDFGGVKRSFNNGASWSYINIDRDVWGIDIAKDDPNVIVYADWGSAPSNTAYISFDEGVHFSSLPVISAIGNFAVYFYNRNTLFLQQPQGYYKLRADISIPIGVQTISSDVPAKYSLEQNYPNPFNPSTNIRVNIPNSTNAKLTVFDILGKEVAVLLNEKLTAGTYNVTWNGAGFHSGVYFYKLETNGFTQTRKMVLVK